MKDFNDDVIKFSMSDDYSDYDEVEEEVIERDEYEDVEGNEEEYYDDEEYYDEEYPEEEYYDDEEYYDEEENYDEEAYDNEGYGEEYYDDRFDRVLDELAELKRSVGNNHQLPQTGQQPFPVTTPLQPYNIFTTTPNSVVPNNDIAMYNEISRLRDELNRTQNSADLHLEISRLKEHMDKEQRAKEELLQSEIRRLNERLESKAITENQRLAEGRSGGSSANFEQLDNIRADLKRLISINESVYKSSRDAEQHLNKEITELKKRIVEMPDFSSVNKSVESLKKSLSTVGGQHSEESNKLLEKKIDELKDIIKSSMNAMTESVESVSGSASLGASSGQGISDKSLDELKNVILNSGSADNSDILRQIFELKSVIGNPDSKETRHNAIVLELYNDYAKVKYDVESTSYSLGDKLVMIDKFAKKLAQSSEAESSDIYNALERLSDRLLANQLSAQGVAEALKMLSEQNSSVSVPNQIKSVIEQYKAAADRLKSDPIVFCIEPLADIIEALNTLQSNKLKSVYDEIYNQVDTLLGEIQSETDERTIREIEAEIESKVLPLTKSQISSICSYKPAKPPKVYKTAKLVEENRALYDRIEEIITLIADSGVLFSEGNQSAKQDSQNEIETILSEITELKESVLALSLNAPEASQANDSAAYFNDMIAYFNDIIARLDDINANKEIENADITVKIDELKAAISGAREADNNDIITRLDELSAAVLILRDGSNEEILAKLDELTNALAAQNNLGNTDRVEVVNEEVLPLATEELLVKLEDLNNGLTLLNSENPDVLNQFNEIKQDYLDIIDRLNFISDSIVSKDENTNTVTVAEETLNMSEDIAFIRDKITEQELFVSQISDLRTDILSLATPAAGENDGKLLEDVVAQLDKLYEDIVTANNDPDSFTNKTLFENAAILEGVSQNVDATIQKIDAIAANINDLSLNTVTKIDDLTISIADVLTSYDRITADISEIKTQVFNDENATVEVVGEDPAAVRVVNEIEQLKDLINANDNFTREQNELLLAQTNILLDEISSIRDTATQARTQELNDENNSAETVILDDTTMLTLSDISEKLNSVLSAIGQYEEFNTAGEIMTLREEVKASRILDQNDVLSELENIRNDLQSLKDDLASITDIRSDISAFHDELKTTDRTGVEMMPTNDEVNMILGEIVSLRDEVQSYKDELSNTFAPTTIDNTVEQANFDESLNTLMDEVTNLRAEIQGYNEEAVLGQKADLDEIKNTIDDLRDAISRRTTLVEHAEGEVEASRELNVVLDEIIDLKDAIADIRSEFTAMKSSEQESTASELQSIKELLTQLVYERELESDEKAKAESIISEQKDALIYITQELEFVKNQLSELTLERAIGTAEDDINTSDSEKEELLFNEISYMREQLENISTMQATKFADDNVYNELTALREDVLALTNAPATQTLDEMGVSQKMSNENFDVLMNEVFSLREDIASLRDAESTNVADRSDSIAIIEELTTLREEIAQLKETGVVSTVFEGEEKNNILLLDEIALLREEIAQLKETSVASTVFEGGEQSNILLLDEITLLREEIAQLKETGVVSTVFEGGEQSNILLLDEITLLREEIAQLKETGITTTTTTTKATEEQDYSIILNEITALREQIAARADVSDETVSSNIASENVNMLFDEVSALRMQIEAIGTLVSTDGMVDNSGIENILEELNALKEQLQTKEPIAASDNSDILNEILSLRDEINAIGVKDAEVVAETGNDVILEQINALKDEINALRTLSEMSSGQEDNDNIILEVSALREEIKSLKEEPDLSVINEVLALRDEFQSFKDEMAQSRKSDDDNTGAASRASDVVLDEVQSLRDQLFAISMASVNDGSGSEATFESYNNLILDELSAMRDEINSLRNAETLKAVVEEINAIKEAIAENKDNDAVLEQFNKLKADLEAIREIETSDATNNAILEELTSLKTELNNQREADATAMNFMSEMAHLLERQNQYINQVANSKITGEMESLKKEIAASLSSVPDFENSTSAIMDEITKLKAELSHTGDAASIDNNVIIEELQKLKEEISREKDSDENRLILREISRLKDEVSAITEKENAKNSAGEDLSQSIYDLKRELSQIADIVTVDDSSVENISRTSTVSKGGTAIKSGTAKKSVAKSNQKSVGSKSRQGSKKSANLHASSQKSTKSGTKRKTSSNIENILSDRTEKSVRTERTERKPVSQIESVFSEIDSESLTSDSLLSKIEAESSELMIGGNSEELNLNFQNSASRQTYGEYSTTADDLDLASRLAKQVANKLIMEQLVQQLGDGGVPKSEVEELVKDILPQEFTTIAIDDQTDKVRRLANSLVLDKLRARLKK